VLVAAVAVGAFVVAQDDDDPSPSAGTDDATTTTTTTTEPADPTTTEPVTGLVEAAEADVEETTGDWVILLTLKEGRPGIDDFNALAAECSATGPACPTGQLAVVVGDEVVTAPSIQSPSFERDQIQISGAFTKRTAEALAERIA